MTETAWEQVVAAQHQFLETFGHQLVTLLEAQQRTEQMVQALANDQRQLHARLASVAEKMGTLVADLVVPSLPAVLHQLLNATVTDVSIRRWRCLADGQQRSFDAIAIMGQQIGLNTTRTTVCLADIAQFSREIEDFRAFFPEYEDFPVVGILAGLALETGVIEAAEQQGLIVLSMGAQIMEIKNQPNFTPNWW